MESSFTSVREMQHATPRTSGFRLGWCKRSSSIARQGPKLCMPTLVMHGSNDYRIPVEVAKNFTPPPPSQNAGCWSKGAATSTSRPATAQWSAALSDLKAHRATRGETTAGKDLNSRPFAAWTSRCV